SRSDIFVSTPPIYFDPDTLNYVKWRAKDVAGNGYTYSMDIPIEILPQRMNHEPVPIISSPVEFTKYLESRPILMDGSMSIDADDDELSYLWYSDKDGYLGTEPALNTRLSQNNHLITLHVSDGIANVSISVSITVVPDITSADTDRDGIPDIIDDDDDNDGLLDIEEDLNMNGLLDENETDPKNPDTDGDGVSDRYDPAPRDVTVTTREVKDALPGWLFVLLIVLIILALLLFGFVWYSKQREDRARMEARSSLRRTRRNLKRFEVLTGVPTNDLPAIEAIQWALPGVIGEAAGFAVETPPSDDLLPPGPGEAPPRRPDLEDMEVPAPAPVQGEEPKGPPAQEPPSAPVEEGPPGNVSACPLCGSEVIVPEGASQTECPLCGEIITL
ncbi:MAG: hypothetical protein JW939_00880, partial [Candidatus Thermoplasmatota archaeon]|nr:hypothetical protein [Candidatus Thermoplasmatota archaeon]